MADYDFVTEVCKSGFANARSKAVGLNFDDSALEAKPGEYRETTVKTGSFQPNQCLTAIAKLAPDAELGEGLSIHYSGGNDLPEEIKSWLAANQIE